ncbi:MAG: phosphotransferase [Pirellulaceae bacterium]|nr:phosphotransferase [Pirellulaceae bacterium]
MAAEISIAPVLEHYPGLGPIRRIHSLANAGGFSGSMLWRLEREAGDLCLRRWPSEYLAERLVFIHGVLKQFGQSGLAWIPVPIPSRTGNTFAKHDGYFWELVPWMPGKADFRENSTRQRLAGVMKAVAQLHLVAESHSPRSLQPSPTLVSRGNQLQRLIAGEIDQISAALERHASQGLQAQGNRLLAHFRSRAPQAVSKLEVKMKLRVPLFPVIRDLLHDHVLFTGDEVTGIVDFGAMRVDSAACDLSRLLGSLLGNDQEPWEFARCTYDSIRPISADEWQLAQALDETHMMLAGLNWLDWICVQGRTFENYAAIHARLDGILVRLEGSRYTPPA